MGNSRKITTLLSGFVIAIGLFIAIFALINRNRKPSQTEDATAFDAQRAYQDVVFQLSLGPRTVGSEAHTEAIQYIQDQLIDRDWNVNVQNLQQDGHPIQNVIAKRGQGYPWIILGAHYDSRLNADRDPDPEKRQTPVPGANDGASGVAVLLEIGRALPYHLDKQVWLVFFDAEDNGELMGWDWLLGSRAFVNQLSGKPDAAIIVDMIGDANLDIYMEASSNNAVKTEIWKQAADLGYPQFIPTVKYSMLDDHTPFLQAGIPAVEIIDFDYPYWHTTSDTLNKVSASSLGVVGETVLDWLLNYPK
jgi:glutaminyl-peptide cyclotransferase